MKGLNKLFFLCFLVLPSVLLTLNRGSIIVSGEEDEIEDEGVVEDEDSVQTEEEPEETPTKNVSPDAETTFLFTSPPATSSVVELPAGKLVEFLVGFSNKGSSNFIVDGLDASFRYPMDFSFHIQNFSTVTYSKMVQPQSEVTVGYYFVPADAFSGRPIGLSVNLAYRDADGNSYLDPVFNETVQIVEFDEGFDSEVFFMYLFLVAGGILCVFLVISFLQSKSTKKKPAAPRPVETGTSNDDVDYEWIPKSAIANLNSSKTSPRQRKSKRAAGSYTE